MDEIRFLKYQENIRERYAHLVTNYLGDVGAALVGYIAIRDIKLLPRLYDIHTIKITPKEVIINSIYDETICIKIIKQPITCSFTMNIKSLKIAASTEDPITSEIYFKLFEQEINEKLCTILKV